MLYELPTLKGFTPRRYDPHGWAPHVPFAYDLMAELRPRLFVELGTHGGQSYFVFCQSAQENDTGTLCYAVDTWKGDAQAGHYPETVYKEVERHNRDHYAAFSYLLRGTFDEALAQFSSGSIDLLHIDGFHAYEAVRHDYETWLPKMKGTGVILFHDIAVRRPGYGVWRLWEEIARPGSAFTFDQGWGLGVLKVSPETRFASRFVNDLFTASETERRLVVNYYTLVADRLRLDHTLHERDRLRRLRHRLKGALARHVPWAFGG